jgi:predicted dehydrogenase
MSDHGFDESTFDPEIGTKLTAAYRAATGRPTQIEMGPHAFANLGWWLGVEEEENAAMFAHNGRLRWKSASVVKSDDVVGFRFSEGPTWREWTADAA